MRLACRLPVLSKFRCIGTGSRSLHQKPANGLSYSYCMPKEPLLPLTIPQVIRAAGADTPDRTFVISRHQQLCKTFSELDRDANRLAHGLQKLGVKRGDRVGIWSPNCYEWIVTQFGTAKLGAVMVSVNPAYREKEFLYCTNLANCHTLIFAQKFKSSNYWNILSNVAPRIVTQKSSSDLSCDEVPDLRNLICLSPLSGTEETVPDHISRFDDILSSSSDQEFVDEAIMFDDAINIQFTSGTTGNPKGATLSHFGTINNAYFSGQQFLHGLLGRTGASICVPNPLYHCFGSVNGVLTAAIFRSTIVLPAATAQAVDTLQAIDEYKCNMVYGTPTMYVDILSQPRSKFDLTSVRRAIMSGSPCPKELILKVKKEVFSNCTSIAIPYGATEASPCITLQPPDVPEKYAYDTVGVALAHTEVKVADPETGSIVKLGQQGEVMTRGFHIFIGYWNQAEKTAEVLDDRHWYHTG